MDNDLNTRTAGKASPLEGGRLEEGGATYSSARTSSPTPTPTLPPLGGGSSPRSSLKQRILSALILVPLAIGWALSPSWLFSLGLGALTLVALWEWWRITRGTSLLLAIFGVPYIGLTAAALYDMHTHGTSTLHPGAPVGPMIVLGTALLLSVIDVSAFIAGKTIGGPKLAPRISPGKTWAGLLGAMLGAGLLLALTHRTAPMLAMVLGGYLLAIVAQLGDLFESWIKRRAGVKDSGRLIPGHGGLLDRLDGYLTAVPLIWLWLRMKGVL